VTGALTVRGRTRPLSFDAAAAVHGDGEVWLDAEVQVNRADFGLTWNLMGMASMHNTLTIHSVFTRR
jgi:polyisoprenoid-binding protein YceI